MFHLTQKESVATASQNKFSALMFMTVNPRISAWDAYFKSLEENWGRLFKGGANRRGC